MNQNKLKKRIWMRLFQLKDLQHASFIHATCEMEKQNIQQLGIKTPIKVIPNGIDISKIPVCSKSYGSRKIVFLSRIHPKKGLELLIEAWSKINTEEWKLVIAGDGDKVYIQQLKALLTQLKINNIEFVGSVYGEDKWKFLLSADLFVLPTYSENFGIAIAEALVMGVPVITTKGTPWSELETYSCGWWIELNVDNLAYTLKSAMLKTPYELQEMGDNGIRLIKNNYDIVNVSLKIKEMYNESVL